jgi:hypothetical protein
MTRCLPLLLITTLLAVALPAHAQLDALGNPVGSEGEPGGNQLTPVDRDDFGPCAIDINFDELVGGGNSCNGDHITNQYPGLLFDVPSGDCVICANSVLGAIIPNNSDPNVAYVQQNTNVCSVDALPGVITFSPPVLMVGMDFFTSVNSDFRMIAYDGGGQVIESLTVVGNDVGGIWSGFAGLQAGGSIIAKVEIYSRSFSSPQPFNFSIDDFIYQITSCPTAVESSSWGMVKTLYR